MFQETKVPWVPKCFRWECRVGGGVENTSFPERICSHRLLVSVLHVASSTIANFKGISISLLPLSSPSTPVPVLRKGEKGTMEIPFQEHGSDQERSG